MPNRARIDFRENSLIETGGFDSVAGANSGSLTVDEDDPGVGIYAMDVASLTDAYGTTSITASSEVYCYAYIILDAAPGGDATVLQFLNNGTVVGELDINASRELELKNDGTQKGSASSALTVGTLYRIGLRQKAGSGADGELQGYLAEKHKNLASFASVSSEAFTTDCDEIRAGAVDGSAFNGRIALIAADTRAFPASYLASHDFLVNNLGFMRAPGTPYQIADSVPAHDRAAIGEARHDTFQTQSFFAQAATGGGAGQSRLVSQDKFLTGIADTRFDGYIFPPRKKQDGTDGGTAYWYFNRGSSLYGVTASTFDLIGTATTYSHGGLPAHKPAVDGQNNVYWATTSEGLRFWDGSSFSSILPTTKIDRAKHVAQYGRHIWLFGEVDIPNIGYDSQDGFSFATSGTSRTNTQSDPNESQYALTLAIATIESGSSSDAASLDLASALTGVWTEGTSITEDDGASTYIKMLVYYIWGGGGDASTITFTHDNSADDVTIQFVNLEGVDPDGTFDFTTDTDAGTGTGLTLTPSAGADFQVSGIMSSASSDSITVPSSWTSISELDSPAAHTAEVAYENASDTTVNWSGMTSGAIKAAWNLNLSEPASAGQTQYTILATDNQGTTWTAAPSNFGPDLFGNIRASVATAQVLWLATDRGLFRMVGQVNQTQGGAQIADVGVTKHDEWEVPKDDNAGNWIASFQGLLYYPVGSTIRRYAPNSSDPNDDRAFWPPSDWSTVVDKVQAVVSNEAGLWFGAAGYLWNFNGRGFHQMASEPATGAFDYLYWHQGNLYIKADPYDYYEYGYPTVRPDILIDQSVLTASDFDTGYFITSSIDFEKVADPKIIRMLETQQSFTSDTNTGSVSWHYRNGCGTDADPGVGSGGDTGSTWTSWGTHQYSDGGYKRHTLSTPLQCYRVFNRATLTPGSGGIPVIHYFTIWGRSIMPSVHAIVNQAQINVGQRDRENNEIIASYGEAKKWLRVVKALRERNQPSETLYHTVTINDGTDGGDEYLATFSQLQESITEDNINQRVTINMTMEFSEIPD